MKGFTSHKWKGYTVFVTLPNAVAVVLRLRHGTSSSLVPVCPGFN